MNLPPVPLARRRRRTIVLVIASLVFFVFYMTSFHDFEDTGTKRSPKPNAIKQDKTQDKKADTGTIMPSGPRTADRPMSYGTAQQPLFKGSGKVIKLDKLPIEHIPTKNNNKRLIIIGDVHGMLEPFQKILKKVDFDMGSGNDHVVLVGDLVNKGPDSAGVIGHAMAIGASAVRGNHEDRVLLAHEAMKKPRVADKIDDLDSEDTLEQIHFGHGDYEDQSTARSLSDKHFKWISKLPVILEAGNVEGFGNLVFVHAGLVPGLDLERQSPWAVMHMRTLVYPREQLRREDAKRRIEKYLKQRENMPRAHPITPKQKDSLINAEVVRSTQPTDREVAVPVDGRDGDPWADVWNHYQKKKVSDADKMTVVYGHDAKQGLSLGRYTYGLDSGCVYGGELTALVISGAPEGVRHEIVQVKCKKAKMKNDSEQV